MTSAGGLSEKFIERLKIIVPNQQIDSVLKSFAQKKPCTFRANPLKILAEDLALKLERLRFQVQRVAWHPSAFILESPNQKELSETEVYKNGEIYLQSLSSLIPPVVLNPEPGEKVLDLCAAPGSKTTQMAALMENQGEIYANDKSYLRGYKLKANLERQGVKIAKVFEYPGEIFWKTFPEQFDKVLVDTPCSLEGIINCRDHKTYSDWSTQKIRRLSEAQKWLLRSAISCAKPGGLIVYATCTLAPEENEEVIDWILKKEKGNVELEPIKIKNLETQSPIKGWKNKTFDPQISKTIRIFPSNLMEGFFVAKIRKRRSNVKTPPMIDRAINRVETRDLNRRLGNAAPSANENEKLIAEHLHRRHEER